MDQFHVKKYRMLEKKSVEEAATTQSDQVNIPGAHLVQSYNIGNERNRNINIQMFMLDDSEF